MSDHLPESFSLASVLPCSGKTDAREKDSGIRLA